MRTDVAQGWTHLQDLLFEGSWNEGLRRFRSPLAYRGVADAAYPQRTALLRLQGDTVDVERHLLRNFIKYARRGVPEGESLWHWLAVAQHHGLPTRLMDWSYSPLVAAHFVTADPWRYNLDGAIWAVNFEQAHQRIPEALYRELSTEGANAFTTELLARLVDSLEEFDHLAEETFLLFFEPPSIDERIVNQFALFSVMSDARASLDDWLQSHGDLCRKIVIPAALKWEIRDKLDQCNITERVLFPGLDGLSQWLRRHYTPRQDAGTTRPPAHGAELDPRLRFDQR